MEDHLDLGHVPGRQNAEGPDCQVERGSGRVHRDPLGPDQTQRLMDRPEGVGAQHHRIEQLARPHLDPDGSPTIRPTRQVQVDLGPGAAGDGDVAATGSRSRPLSVSLSLPGGAGSVFSAHPEDVLRRQPLDPTRAAELIPDQRSDDVDLLDGHCGRNCGHPLPQGGQIR